VTSLIVRMTGDLHELLERLVEVRLQHVDGQADDGQAEEHQKEGGARHFAVRRRDVAEPYRLQ